MLLPTNPDQCPYLLLAPMEGVGDRAFRKAMASLGGFNEAVTEFLRVPKEAHVISLARAYQSDELTPFPLTPQLMGSDPYLMSAMAQEIEARGALRIDLNCGCPSNTVTGKGAGSSLLKTPSLLYTLVKTLVQAVQVPVTVKMRSGYEDTSLFKENILSIQEAGASFVTLHPRTKKEGYTPPANWDLIAEAKALLKIPVVGNGDILTVQDALNMLQQTHCDALMIGRGALINPFIFHQIRAHFSNISFEITYEQLFGYFEVFMKNIPPEMPDRNKMNKLKQLVSFLFKGNEKLLENRQSVLTYQATSAKDFLNYALSIYRKFFFKF